MKILFATLVALLCSGSLLAQTHASNGTGLLFQNIKTKLSPAEKSDIYNQLGFLLAEDGKRFIADEDAAEFPFDAMVYPTDMNGDGKEEVFVVFGNGFTSGATGSTVILFIKDKNGKYQSNLGFPGTLPDAFAAPAGRYPDLLIGGPGFEYPVWSFKNGEYVYSRKVKDAAMKTMKLTSVETLSKKYTAGL
ncbi:MAG: hypothetical protein ACO1OO_07145 [Flavisolibacter sp.]